MSQKYNQHGMGRDGIALKVAQALDPLYARGYGYQFVTQNAPTYFATDLVIRHRKPEGYGQIEEYGQNPLG